MRGKAAPKREIAPDPKYHNVAVQKLINYMMREGKKTVAQKVLYGAFTQIEETAKQDPVTVFDTAIRNVSPVLEVNMA